MGEGGETHELAFVTSASLKKPLRLVGAAGHDGMSTLFEVDLLLACEHALDDDEVEALLDVPCAIAFGSGPGQLMCGVIHELTDVDTNVDEALYLAKLVPRAHALTLTKANRVLLDLTVPEMVGHLLDLYGIPVTQHLLATYEERALMVQYEETDWAFLSRWLDHYGICHWFAHEAGGDELHLGDAHSVMASAQSHVRLPHASRSSLQLSRPVVDRLCRVWRRGPSRVLLYDVDDAKPTCPPRYHGHVDSPFGFGAQHRFGGARYLSKDEGVELARRRVEGMQQNLCSYHGLTNASVVRAGTLLDVADEEGGVTSLLVTHTRFHVGVEPGMATALGSLADHEARRYRAEFDAIDAAQTYRPPATTPWPRIDGVVVGYVEADAGDLATPDEQGRYLLRLPLASPGQGEVAKGNPLVLGGNETTPRVRVAQLAAGRSEGSHVPLRAGTPVLVAFHQGDPDRPYVVAPLANELTAHLGTEDNATQTVWGTASGNRFVMEDKNVKGDES